jgi:hypothetical protein
MNRMKSVLLLALVALCAGSAQAQKAVELDDPPVTFTPPPGFKAWTPEQIARKYPPPRPPRHVFAADENGKVSIAVSSTPAPADLKDLAQLQKAMAASYEAAPLDLKWLRRETLTMNGTSWVHLELETQALDTRIHNDLYATLAGGTIVVFNFNAVARLYDKRLQAALQKSRDSITLKPRSLPAGSPP